MRIIGYIPHDQCKITVFKMDNRFSVKIENRQFEETFKLRMSDRIDSLADIQQLVDEELIQHTLQRFSSMNAHLNAAIQRNLPLDTPDDEFEEII
ncbi:MAG: hypothetical protein AAF598_05645 [Bacteroidota bacterium]